jgi:hypothetical protein
MRAPVTETTATLSKVHASPARTLFQEGLLAGTWGTATMTFWFLLLDGVAGHPLYTPNRLGTALFHGGGGQMPSAHSAFSLRMVGAFTATYRLLCVLQGAQAAGLLALAAQEPNLGFGVLLFLVLTTAGLVGGAMLCAEPVLQGLAWPAVLLGHLGAVGAMGGSLWRQHAPLVIYP